MIDRIICPRCQEELEMDSKKYICPCCEKEWNELLLESKDYYNSKAIDNINTLYAFEYHLIEDLLEKKQIYGIIFQIKDIYEILIRIPVLIVCAISFRKEQNIKSKELLYYLMSKPLSLGDWRYLLNLSNEVLREYSDFPDEVVKLVQNTRKLVNSDKYGDIVYWRNNTIAHGATKTIDDYKLYDDVACKLKELTNFFVEQNELLSKLVFIADDGCNLNQINVDFSETSGKLKLYVGGEKYDLYPFFDLRREGIFLFDRYIKKQQKTDIIEYLKSIKHSVSIKELNNLFLESSFQAENNSINLDAYSIEERNICEEFLSSGEFLIPDFLVNWLEVRLKSSKAVFMLQMEKGMGKSFFVRGLDPYAVDKIYIDNLSVKTFYINSTYNSRIDDFSIFIEDQMRKVSRGNTIANNTFRLNINASNLKKEFARFLNNYKKTYYSDKKLLFIFDGIDEINVQPGKNITDFIPDEEYLDNGVYVMVTCRTKSEDDNISKFSKDYIDYQFKGEIFEFTQESEEYQKFIKNYFDLYIIKKIILLCKRNGAKFIIDYEKTDRLFDGIEDKSILNLTLIKELLHINIVELIKNNRNEIYPDDLLIGENMYEHYFSNIKNQYGSKYYKKFINVLCCLSLADKPLTLRELAVLSGNDNLNFAFLGFTNSMRHFLGTIRSSQGTKFVISHLEQDKVIKKVFKEQLKEIGQYIASKIYSISNDKFDFGNNEELIYYYCFNSVYSLLKDEDNNLFYSLLNLPYLLSWSQNYYEVINELEILKNIELFVDNKNIDTRTRIKIGWLYTNAGLDGLILNRYSQSEYYFLKAISIYEEEYNNCNEQELYDFSELLSYYATLKWRNNDNHQAMEIYKRGIDVKKILKAKKSQLITDIHMVSEDICYANIANSAQDYLTQKKVLDDVEKRIGDCEDSDFKRRTLPFLNLSWFYYYRDTQDYECCINAIERTIKGYLKCLEKKIGFFIPDLVKSYIYFFKYILKVLKTNSEEFLSKVDEAEKCIENLKKKHDYNDEETYLDYLFTLSINYLEIDQIDNSLLYRNKAYDYLDALDLKRRENPKLTEIIKSYEERIKEKYE